MVSEGCGCVRGSATVSKGRGWTTRTEILCFLFGSGVVAGSWLGGCFGGCQTLTLEVNVNLLRGNCILVMKNGQKIRPKLPETDIKL